MTSDQDSKAVAEPQVQTAPKDSTPTPLPPQLPGLTRSVKAWANHMASLDASVPTRSMVVQSEHEQSAGPAQERDRGDDDGGVFEKQEVIETVAPPTVVQDSSWANRVEDPAPLSMDHQEEKEIPQTEEEMQRGHKNNLRETLTKTLQFCLSRENLFSDMYLASQMDSDQYVPIVTVANLDHIKTISSDMQLIVDILTSLPHLQVDESGERVRLNQNRCIVILREIPQNTPVQEIEALFHTEDMPKFLSCEFAYNDSWYITFQTEAAAQQAYHYLREEVKTFQGKPIKARIKAKAMAFSSNQSKNGFQQAGVGPPYAPPTLHHFLLPPAETPSPPATQQFPYYAIIPHTHTALQVAPFPNSSFMHNYSSPPRFRNASPFHRTPRRHQCQRGVCDDLMPSQSPPSQTHCSRPQPAGIGYPSHDVSAIAMPQPISSECSTGRGSGSHLYSSRTKREERLTDSEMSSPVRSLSPALEFGPSNFPPLPSASRHLHTPPHIHTPPLPHLHTHTHTPPHTPHSMHSLLSNMAVAAAHQHDGCVSRVCSPVSSGRAMLTTPPLPSNLLSPPSSAFRPTYSMENGSCEKEIQVSVERMLITVTTANKSIQVNGFATEGCKPSYAEICQRIRDSCSSVEHAHSNQQPIRMASPSSPRQLSPGPGLLTPPTSPQ